MKALVLAAALLLVGLAVPAKSEAHPLKRPHASGFPVLHEIGCLLGRCHDPAPKPDKPCGPGNEGEEFAIYDPGLDAVVVWKCQRTDDGFGWRRKHLKHYDRLPWQHSHWRTVVDFQRACDSIVCDFVAVEHRYRTKQPRGWWRALSP